MTDENKEQNETPENHEEFEEEFDFEEGGLDEPHEDILSAEGESEAPESAPAPRKSGMGLPLIIALAVVGFIGWKIYGKFKAPKHPTAVEQAANLPTATPAKTQPLPPAKPAPAPAPKPVTPPPVEHKPVPLPPPPAPVVEAKPLPPAKAELSTESLNAIQKKIDEQEQFTKQQISTLEKDLQMSVQSTANASKSLSALQQELSTLSNAIQDLSQEVKAVREEQARIAASHAHKAAPKHKAPVERAEPNPSLTVHAVIPGRAWLRGHDGKITTVSEGDTVGEYGKVLKIDAANGIVITSSGVTLR